MTSFCSRRSKINSEFNVFCSLNKLLKPSNRWFWWYPILSGKSVSKIGPTENSTIKFPHTVYYSVDFYSFASLPFSFYVILNLNPLHTLKFLSLKYPRAHNNICPHLLLSLELLFYSHFLHSLFTKFQI